MTIERAIREFEQRERVERGLRELRAAPALDLRLRHALIELDTFDPPSSSTPTSSTPGEGGSLFRGGDCG